MSATQRARSAVPLDMRSVAPTVPGVPWWGAVLVAAGSTLLGFLIDAARGNELGSAFSAFYVLGCVAAVAAVQHRALFTAMAQPPLLLLVAVPIAQEFLVESGGGGLKDLALNVAYPLVNRFPVMLTATVAVLVVGGLRIFLSRSQVPAPARPPRRGARAAGAPSRDSQLDRDGGGAAKPARGRRARAAARPPASTKASVRQVADTRDNPVVRRRTTAPAPDAARRGAGEPPAAPDVAYRTRRAEPAPRRAEPAPRRAEPAPRRAEPAPRRAAETRRDYDRRGDHRSRPDRPYERGEVPPPSRRRAPGPETPDYRQPRVRYRDRYED